MEKRRNTRRRSSEKVLMILLVAVVLIGCAVGGSIAYFTDKTETVTNTFTVGKIFANPSEDFTLWEHKAVDEDASGKKDGVFELTTEKVDKNEYTVLPGVNLPKNPTVDIVNLELNAYLYIKVENRLPAGMTVTIDDEKWAVMDANNGIYVYCGEHAENNVISANPDENKTFTVNILEDYADAADDSSKAALGQKIIVAEDFTTSATDLKLQFTAYAVQAPGFDSAEEAWATTFGKPANP